MSEDSGDDINFSELVGNLLSSHNQGDRAIQDEEDVPEHADVPSLQDHEDVQLPDFAAEDDLEAVANAIKEHMDSEEPIPTHTEAFQPHEIPPEEGQIENGWSHELVADSQKEVTSSHHELPTTEDQLDQDDEHLRAAILQSLQHLKSKDTTGEQRDKDTSTKASKKKASKKKKKKQQEKGTIEKENESKTKKKQSKKTAKTTEDDETVLDFEDVIKGFMDQGAAPQIDTGSAESQPDVETQALVEATLKAFEKELSGTPTQQHQKQKSASRKKSALEASKTKSSSTTSIEKEKHTVTESSVSTKTSSKKKKEKKSTSIVESKSSKNGYEDDFSKALVEMVNQVVNNSIAEPTHSHVDITAQSKHIGNRAGDIESIEEAPSNDTFDLNQIMQKAMAMAFQEEHQHVLDQSTIEDFNRELGDVSVADILGDASTSRRKLQVNRKLAATKVKNKKVKTTKLPKEKKKLTKISESRKEVKLPKPSKPQPSPEELLRKAYKKVAQEAASVCKSRIREKNRADKLAKKESKRKESELRKLQKQKEKEKFEAERKELEEIVARGPPYPADLRVTKKGTPKKPYRRWTPEEMAKRATMAEEESKKPQKVRKPKKKKAKKPKKIPLSTLKKIPLFNFVKENLSSCDRDKLNDIEGSLSKVFQEVDIGQLIAERSSALSERKKKAHSHKTKGVTFDALATTIVKREKFLFHPPWRLPLHPPLALPAARRKGKGFTQMINGELDKQESLSRSFNIGQLMNFGNGVATAILLPIIKTLKAAAKSKLSSGSSPEETSRHLMTIIKHTKQTIADSLAKNRQNVPTRNYSTIKTEDDIDLTYSKPVKKIPIFTLSKIRQIDTSDNKNENVSESVRSSNKAPSIIKIENAENNLDGFHVHEEPTAENNISLEKTEQSEVTDSNDVEKEVESSNSRSNGVNDKPAAESDKVVNATEESTVESESILVSEKKDIPSAEQNSSSASSNESSVTPKPKVEVISLVEGLVKKHVDEDTNASDNLSNMIASTISDLIPDLVVLDGKRSIPSVKLDSLSNVPQPKVRAPYPKRPPPPLNLEGVVPLFSANKVAKIESSPETLNRTIDLANNVSRARKSYKPRKIKENSSIPQLYTFHVPDNIKGKRPAVMRHAKEMLTPEEMIILTRTVNKERKRKWRIANSSRNWEHDLRSRLKKQAAKLFADDEVKKNEWIETEFETRRNDAEYIKDEREKDTKITGSTNITDNELLNMIAVVLNKVDVARQIEANILKKIKPYLVATGIEQYEPESSTSSSATNVIENHDGKRIYDNVSHVDSPAIKKIKVISTQEQ